MELWQWRNRVLKLKLIRGFTRAQVVQLWRNSTISLTAFGDLTTKLHAGTNVSAFLALNVIRICVLIEVCTRFDDIRAYLG